MKTIILPNEQLKTKPVQLTFFQQWMKTLVVGKLSLLKYGKLQLSDIEGTLSFGSIDQGCPLSITITVHHPSFYTAMVLGGSIGVSESYMRGDLACDDLTGFVRIFALNEALLLGVDKGFSRFSQFFQRFYHWLNRNSLKGSCQNIEAHYDLGNDFYRLFLDETMMYSCAIFPNPDSSLCDAQKHRLDVICRKLDLQPDDQLIEIGTGWGALSIHAAKKYGCHVTTTTISKEQYEWTKRRIADEGLQEHITLLNNDYRSLPDSFNQKFDKIVSIEMIEAVGHVYFDTFFKICSDLLKPSGLMLLQAITIKDQRYEAAKESVDFIQRYIFPGGALPSISVITDCVKRVTDFTVFDLHEMGPHYVKTLQCWHNNFFTNIDTVRKLGFSERFIRMWEAYFCYCEGAFKERVIGAAQLLLSKPYNRCQVRLKTD
jgi:cyclopropane-fatty-acyl-phospholipid synthase